TWLWILAVPQAVLTTSAFAMTAPVLQAVVPYRLPGMATAMSTTYILFIGGFGRGVISGFCTDAIGVRQTVIALRLPTSSSAGVVRLNGRNISYVGAEQRVRLGIVSLPGGKGVFPSLTVGQNLAVSAWLGGGSNADVEQRIDSVLALFPELGGRRRQSARSLS